MKLLKEYWPFFLIFAVGAFLRLFKPLEFLNYWHDNDLAGWIIKDVLVNKHLRLIGQETSSQGIFVGPLFYYALIPFYLIAKMDPLGGIILSFLIGTFSIFSFYFVFTKVFSKKIGIFASLIYSFSYLAVFTDRDVVPTTPVMLWSVWFFYGIWFLLKGRQKMYLLLGFLLGLVWHLNLALAVLSPLILIAQFLSKKRISTKWLLLGVSAFMVLMLPYFVFEARHDFLQTKAVFSSLSTEKDYEEGVSRGWAKVDRVLQLVSTNTTRLFWGQLFLIPVRWTLYILIFLFILLTYKKIIPRKFSLILVFWQVAYIAFFSINSINVSEYYLNGMNVVWIGILALGINYLFEKKKLRALSLIVIGIFIFCNLYSFSKYRSNRAGYLEKKQIVNFIDQDAKSRGFECISVSYITAPGYELGYRYFFWLKKMHVNQPKSGSPVYSVVFPLSYVNRLDKIFGAIGLVLPDYQRYTKEDVTKSCTGANSNLTDPMFGYTQ